MFNPQKYNIADQPGRSFIDAAEIRDIYHSTLQPSRADVEKVISRSLSRHRLTLAETAVLLRADTPELMARISEAASELKKEIYGNRIVLFAPLYVGNRCVNNCRYCGFRAGNNSAIRKTLSRSELKAEAEALEKAGQKRLILVFGEHPAYDPLMIAGCVRDVYDTRGANDAINRININAAPLDVEGFRTIREAGIGTYQIFQETYDPDQYAFYHPTGPKSDYDYRLTALDRAMQAGIDDVGLGVLFGLSDWRFEVLSLVRHVNHLEACFGVGPHTISFPRIKNASNAETTGEHTVSDADFERLIAILRLSVPYAGLILTAREPMHLRSKLIRAGISQVDAGTRLEIGGYSSVPGKQCLEKEQFELMDSRSLDEVVSELVATGNIPSFCTACYRQGRTGEHFMAFSTQGHIKKFCDPNALLTFAEYLRDYASPETSQAGNELIMRNVEMLEDPQIRESTKRMLRLIKEGESDFAI